MIHSLRVVSRIDCPSGGVSHALLPFIERFVCRATAKNISKPEPPTRAPTVCSCDRVSYTYTAQNKILRHTLKTVCACASSIARTSCENMSSPGFGSVVHQRGVISSYQLGREERRASKPVQRLSQIDRSECGRQHRGRVKYHRGYGDKGSKETHLELESTVHNKHSGRALERFYR